MAALTFVYVFLESSVPAGTLREVLSAVVASGLAGFVAESVRFATAAAAAAMVAWGAMMVGLVSRPHVQATYVDPIADFVARYGKTAILLIVLIGTYRIADIVMGAIANVFYLDQGYDKSQIATYSKFWGLWATIAGGFAGGVLAMRYGVHRALFLGAALAAASNLLFAYLAVQAPAAWLLGAVVVADNLSAGLAGAAFVAFLSSLTNVSFTAMQYALFTSIMLLFPKVLAGYSGTMVDSIGYPFFFIGTAILGIPVLVLVWLAGRLVPGSGGSARRRIPCVARHGACIGRLKASRRTLFMTMKIFGSTPRFDLPDVGTCAVGNGGSGIQTVEQPSGHLAGLGRRVRRLRGKGPASQRGPHRAGVEADHPWRAGGFDLFGEHPRKTLDSGLRHRVCAPVGAGVPPESIGDEHHRRVGHALEHGQAGSGDQERRGQIDVHGAQPVLRLEVRERRESRERGGGVHDAVEPAERPVDALRQLRVVAGTRAGKVHRIDGGRGTTGFDDPVVGRPRACARCVRAGRPRRRTARRRARRCGRVRPRPRSPAPRGP